MIDPYVISQEEIDACCGEVGYVLNCLKHSGKKKELLSALCTREGKTGIQQDCAKLLMAYLGIKVKLPKKKKEKIVMCKGIEDLMKDCKNQGVKQGVMQGEKQERERGILNFISFCRRHHFEDSSIIEELKTQYSLTVKQAKNYLLIP